eukprot:scaffold32490_cov58-Phaeocystis_antarctica.AAC.7
MTTHPNSAPSLYPEAVHGPVLSLRSGLGLGSRAQPAPRRLSSPRGRGGRSGAVALGRVERVELRAADDDSEAWLGSGSGLGLGSG